MRPRVIVLLALLGLAGVGSSVALGRHSHADACVVNTGTISGYHVTVKQSCAATVTTHAPIHATETLSSLTPGGTMDFGTAYLAQCHQNPGAVDIVAPSPTVAIIHKKGTTWCRHLASQKNPTYLTTLNAKILIKGTIVGLTYTSGGSLIQLVEGTAAVTPSAAPKLKVVPQSTQLFVPSTGTPGKPTPLVLAPADQPTVAALQQSVIQMGEPQVAEFLRSRSETSAVIIGDTLDNAKAQAALLPNVRVALLTTDQVRAKPAIVPAQMEQIGARSVITVGAFSAVGPVWQILRTQVQLPTGNAIVYATP